MKPPTKQEMFNRMVRGLASQGWEQSKNRGRCVYWGGSGRKCAVGWLVPGDKYKPEMDSEQYSLRALMTEVWGGDFFENLWEFLARAQARHDNAYSPGTMRLNFEKLAEKYGLDWPEDVK